MLERNFEVEEVLELLEQKQFNKLKEYLGRINGADFPSIFEALDEKDMIIIFRLLNKEEAAEIFAELDADLQEKLINSFSDTELKYVVDNLFMDDTVDMIEEMPSNVVKRILKNVNEKDRKVINEILNYPDDCAGSIMTTEFVDLKEDMTVEDAFAKIKKIGLKKETVYNCYVLDKNRKLLGVIDIKDLLIADRTEKIKELMDDNIITVTTLDDKEDVAKIFDKYDYVALPVVDKEFRLVGIVTVDDAIDVMKEEASEDFEKMAAITPNEDGYYKTPVIVHAKNRIVWLLFLMFSSIVTGAVITHYEQAFAALPVLVSFIPMIMGTGGNCGSQSSTLVIRGLAVDEIHSKDFLKVWWKEIRVAVIVGIIMAIVNCIRIYIQYKDLQLGLVVGLTLIVNIMISKSLGSMLPLICKKLKLDPAIMAAPLISTILDTCSVLVFFNIAVAIMHI